MKFFLFDFHQYFDALLGMYNLKLLKLKIDLTNNIIENPQTKINLLFRPTQPEVFTMTIHPESEHIVQIPVDKIPDGDILIPEIKFSTVKIPSGIVSIKNKKMTCSIINNTERTLNLKIKEPLKIKNFEYFEEANNGNKFSTLNNIESKDPDKVMNKIKTDHMNSEEKAAVINLIKQYTDIFYQEGQNLTFTSNIKHKIRTTDEIPVYTKTYRYPQIHREEVQRQIQKMLEQGIIRPSNSPWSSPIWIVPKKVDSSGKRKWHMVTDYRKLNEKTIGDRYPLPNINDRLGRSQYFTCLDLASGFYQIEVDEDSIQKTAFNTEQGHFEYLRMPMGLSNSPATFQRAMNNILSDLINEACLVYLDDIIIFSTSLQEHLTNIKKVFDRLRQCNLKIQLDKSHFLSKEVAYLGHIVTPEGVKPNPDKIKAIKEYPIPRTTKQIKGFLGLLGYYRKFIPDFAKVTKPLSKCLKKDAKINIHDKEYQECFELCKHLLTNEPILQYPDFNKPFNLTTDASNAAIGAVLSQGSIGNDKTVAYASRTLSDTESSYSTIEKEALAIVWAVKYFRPYLFGQKFKIYSDHKPLQWLFSQKDPSSKLIRWRLKLEEYDYEIIYKKGTLNTNADALSRIEMHPNELNADETWSTLVEPDTHTDDIDLDRLLTERYTELIGSTDALENEEDFLQHDLAENSREISEEQLTQENQIENPVSIVTELENQLQPDSGNEEEEDDEEDITVHSNIEHP